MDAAEEFISVVHPASKRWLSKSIIHAKTVVFFMKKPNTGIYSKQTWLIQPIISGFQFTMKSDKNLWPCNLRIHFQLMNFTNSLKKRSQNVFRNFDTQK